jgi:hypothetical protein
MDVQGAWYTEEPVTENPAGEIYFGQILVLFASCFSSFLPAVILS